MKIEIQNIKMKLASKIAENETISDKQPNRNIPQRGAAGLRGDPGRSLHDQGRIDQADLRKRRKIPVINRQVTGK